MSRYRMRDEFAKFLDKIRQFEKDRFETRAFAYLDIISWVEGKVYNKPMSQIIAEKSARGRKRVYQQPELKIA
jgi:hypothetical protein